MFNRFDWKTAPCSFDAAESIAAELHLPPLVGTVLARRGFSTAAEARAFLDVNPHVPDPFLLEGMEAATAALEQALGSRRRIVVHGDYDADGLSAAALMVLELRRLGGRCEAYIPQRFREGYGLSETAVRAIAAEGDALLVTVDCGVNYPAEVALALELGLEVVVTDHHELGEVLPSCPVVHQQLGSYPGAELCGVGVALKTLHGLHARMGTAERTLLPEALLEYLDIVALGTVADIVPLRGENRYYVQEGLRRLRWSTRPGLRTLARVAGGAAAGDASSIGFRLAPRINAAGRMGDPTKALALLLTDDETEAAALALELHELNLVRQATERDIMAGAQADIEALPALPPVLVLAHEQWHEGVVGIVASRLVERFHRPVVLLAVKEGRARGSGRSITRYDLMEGLRYCSDLLTVFGGHSQAAGLTLSAENIDLFADRLRDHAASHLRPEDLVPAFAPDAVVCGEELTLETAEGLARLAPFGSGNPPVRLLAVGVDLKEPQLTRTGDHLRCSLEVDGIRTKGIGFRLGPALEKLEGVTGRVHAAFELGINEWNGLSRPELVLHSLYESEDRGEAALGCTPQCPFLDEPSSGAPCAHCADPYAGLYRESLPTGGGVRRGAPSYSRIAQILSCGEPAAIISASVPIRLRAVVAALPLANLGVGGVDCVSRLCWRTRSLELRPDALLFADWTAVLRRSELLEGKAHVVVLDPPYSHSHTHVLSQAAGSGSRIHCLYGEREREFTANLLKFMLHPRPAMVGVYRALAEIGPGDACAPGEVLRQAAQAMWESQGFQPAFDELHLAWRILRDMGIGDGDRQKQPTREPEDVGLFREAVASYQEAVGLCRTL